MQVSVERLGLLETEILSFHPSKLFPKVKYSIGSRTWVEGQEIWNLSGQWPFLLTYFYRKGMPHELLDPVL